MIAAALRIRLEGRVEDLEHEVSEWESALREAQGRRFGPAARMLEGGSSTLTAQGDRGLAKLLARQASLQRAVEEVVAERLRLLGMPTVDLARGANWLVGEPVLYEHHRLTPAFLFRALHFAVFLIVIPTIVSGFMGIPVVGLLGGLVLFTLMAQAIGWSHVVLTPCRLVLEGDVLDLTQAKEVLIIRPFLERLTLRCEVEVRQASGRTQHAQVRCATRGLRAELRRLGIGTGADGGPW